MVTRSQGERDWVSSIALRMCGKFFKFVKAILTICKTLFIICYFYNSFTSFLGGAVVVAGGGRLHTRLIFPGDIAVKVVIIIIIFI